MLLLPLCPPLRYCPHGGDVLLCCCPAVLLPHCADAAPASAVAPACAAVLAFPDALALFLLLLCRDARSEEKEVGVSREGEMVR